MHALEWDIGQVTGQTCTAYILPADTYVAETMERMDSDYIYMAKKYFMSADCASTAL